MSGAFQTSREIFDNPIWKNIVDFRLFFLIYGKAVFSNEGVRLADDLVLKRGQWCRSLRNLQKDLEYVENRQVKTYSLSVLNRCISRAVASQRLCTKTHELGTVFTVVNYELYQGFGGYKKDNLEQNLEHSGNSEGTLGEHSGNNNKNVKNVNKKPSSPKQVYDEQSIPYRTANYLYTNILKFKPDLKQPNLQIWSDDMRKLIELDKRNPKEIGKVIEWVTTNDFWQSNILSAKKLRDNWDTVTAKMKQDEFKPSRNTTSQLPLVTLTDEERAEHARNIEAIRRKNGVSA